MATEVFQWQCNMPANLPRTVSGLAALEKELKDRLNVHEAAIVTILQRVMDIIDPPALPEPPKKDIGFRTKEGKTRYVVRRKTG